MKERLRQVARELLTKTEDKEGAAFWICKVCGMERSNRKIMIQHIFDYHMTSELWSKTFDELDAPAQQKRQQVAQECSKINEEK